MRAPTFAGVIIVALCNTDRVSLYRRYQKKLVPVSSTVEFEHVSYSINCRYLLIMSDTIDQNTNSVTKFISF